MVLKILFILLLVPFLAQAHPWSQLPRTADREENIFYFQENFGKRYLFMGTSRIGSFRMIANPFPKPTSSQLSFSVTCQFYIDKPETAFIELFDVDYNVIARYDVMNKACSGLIEMDVLKQIKFFVFCIE